MTQEKTGTNKQTNSPLEKGSNFYYLREEGKKTQQWAGHRFAVTTTESSV